MRGNPPPRVQCYKHGGTNSRQLTAYCDYPYCLSCLSLFYVICYVKGKGQDTSYSAAYMSQTRDQQHFTMSEVAADWHEPMVPQRIMWPSH